MVLSCLCDLGWHVSLHNAIEMFDKSSSFMAMNMNRGGEGKSAGRVLLTIWCSNSFVHPVQKKLICSFCFSVLAASS